MVVITRALSDSPLLPSRQNGRFRVIVATVALTVASVLVIYSQIPGRTASLFEYEHDGGHSGAWKGTTDPADLTDDQVHFLNYSI